MSALDLALGSTLGVTGNQAVDRGSLIIIAALTMLVVLAWSDIIKDVVRYLFPTNLTDAQALLYKFMYAVVITVIASIGVLFVTQATNTLTGPTSLGALRF